MKSYRWISLLLFGVFALAAVLLSTMSPPASAVYRQETVSPANAGYLPYVVKQYGTAHPSPTPTTPAPSLTPTPGCPPTIEFTSVPPYGSFEDLQGLVTCVDPAEYYVAVYIYMPELGWWTKPYWSDPRTAIHSNRTWTCDITTGGYDQYATEITACVLPDAYDPPSMGGEPALPPELFENAAACLTMPRGPTERTVEFSGYTWKVKAGAYPVGPGPNYFSDRPEDVWVDGSGQLHLTVTYQDSRWYCTEVVLSDTLGYGAYTFTLAGRVDQLDKNVVLGLFTWDEKAPEYNYREIDVEFSRWGEEGGLNSQYVVQPWSHAGNRYRFDTALEGVYSTHRFNWSNDRVDFASYQGHRPNLGGLIQSWVYTGTDVPPSGEENVRMNLWLFNGTPPSDGQAVEVVIESFEFAPHPPISPIKLTPTLEMSSNTVSSNLSSVRTCSGRGKSCSPPLSTGTRKCQRWPASSMKR